MTAAPAGWCDQMARMWPVDGVIGENGGFYFQRDDESHGLKRIFWHDEAERRSTADQLAQIVRTVQASCPFAVLAEDHPFRLTSVAFEQPKQPDSAAAIVAALRAAGADVTVNNLWVLGWLGGYDKLAMARRILAQSHGLDVDMAHHEVLYVGDSTNDAPMFDFFRHTIGVSTVRNYLSEIPAPPTWIAAGPGGSGFVEAADAVLLARQS